ncbi:MAG: glycosyltransferase family A protein [Pseudomonadota bacterium]
MTTDAARPLVSVVIPTYNHAHFLGRALKSVLEQTYTNWEAVVIDNHSQDNTDEVINSFNDPRIKTLKIHNHGVIAASRNAGIEAAIGDWIAFLDSDDLWYPRKLEVVMGEISRDLSFEVYSTDEILVNELTGDKSPLVYGPSCPDFYKALLVSGNRLSPSAALVCRKFLGQKKIQFRENRDFVTAEDYDLWLLLARAGARFKFLHSAQGEYRIHASNSSGQIDRHGASTRNVIKDHVYNLQSFELDAHRLWRAIDARLLLADSGTLIRKRKFVAAIHALIKAFRASSPGALHYLAFRLANRLRHSTGRQYPDA